MSHDHRTYTSDRAYRIMETISEVLKQPGGATVTELSLITSLSANRVGEFLREMKKQGTAVCIERSRNLQGGSTPARWGPATATPALEDTDDMPRKVIVRQEWEPNHARMKLDCYLFGVPAVLAA